MAKAVNHFSDNQKRCGGNKQPNKKPQTTSRIKNITIHEPLLNFSFSYLIYLFFNSFEEGRK